MTQTDFETPRRREWLAGTDDTLDAKRAAAIAWLGERWLLHPANAPKRGRYFYGQPKRVRT